MNNIAPAPYRAHGNKVKALEHGKWFTLAWVDSPKLTDDAQAATAKLFALSPNLAEALEWALNQIDDDLDPDHQAALAAAWQTLNEAKQCA
jgi:hypothetical protein